MFIKLCACYICGIDCPDQDPGWVSCCGDCSYNVKIACGEKKPSHFADGFPKSNTRWMTAVQQAMTNYNFGGYPTLTTVPMTGFKVKKYIGECPCGLKPEQCEYHNG
jgi:hypothetical protein